MGIRSLNHSLSISARVCIISSPYSTSTRSANMTLAPMLVSTLLCGMVFTAKTASLESHCKIPTELRANYYELLTATNGNKFLQLAMAIPTVVNQSLEDINETCPDALPSNGDIKDRSRCPWSNHFISDTTMFPSEWYEAICRCHDCRHQGMHNCQIVYTDMFFLKRMPGCVDGFFVYEHTIKKVATSCVCASMKTGEVKSSALSSVDIEKK